MAGILINAVENRMVIGDYYEDDECEDDYDQPELPFEAFDRRLMALFEEMIK